MLRITLCRIIDLPADGADIFSGRRLLDEFRGRNRNRRIVQINHSLRLQILIAKRRVGAAIDRRILANECANAV